MKTTGLGLMPKGPHHVRLDWVFLIPPNSVLASQTSLLLMSPKQDWGCGRKGPSTVSSHHFAWNCLCCLTETTIKIYSAPFLRLDFAIALTQEIFCCIERNGWAALLTSWPDHYLLLKELFGVVPKAMLEKLNHRSVCKPS